MDLVESACDVNQRQLTKNGVPPYFTGRNGRLVKQSSFSQMDDVTDTQDGCDFGGSQDNLAYSYGGIRLFRAAVLGLDRRSSFKTFPGYGLLLPTTLTSCY